MTFRSRARGGTLATRSQPAPRAGAEVAMCLAVPGRVLAVEGLTATVDFGGVQRRVRIDVVDAPVAPGDHVLVHAGFAIRRLAPEEAEATLALFAELAAGEPPRTVDPPDGERRRS